MAFFVRERDFYKRFFTMALVIAAQNLLAFGLNLADNIMVGAYSESALAGVALVNQIQYLLQMIALGATEGVVILGSRCWGRRETEPIHRISGIGMRFSLSISLFIFLATTFFPAQILRFFTNDAAVIAEGLEYLRYVKYSYLFYGACVVLIATMRSVETVKVGLYTASMSLVLDTLLNYMFIYGRLGAPRMGVAGAGASTVFSRAVELGFLLFYVLRVDKKLRLRLSAYFKRLEKGMLRSFVKVSWPMMVSGSLWGSAQGLQSAILGHLGQSAVAASSISMTLFQVMSVVGYGAASATSVLISKTIGEGRQELLRPYVRTLQVIFIGIGLCTGTAIFFARNLMLSFYNLAPDTMALARNFIVVVAIMSVGTCYQVPCLNGIVQGGGQTDFILYNNLVFMWGVTLPLSTAAAFWLKLPPLWVFACLKNDQITKSFVAVVKVNRFKWVRHLDTHKKEEEQTAG